ncbi:MAG: hypothetical protein NUV91_07110, partial [Candidatus Omnitrophica bacterium]|nr:hypothetical protein [Candidatus Omnitrophota bacterium]
MKKCATFTGFALLCFLFFPINGHAAEPPQYFLQAQWDETQKELIATEKVVFTNPTSKPLKELYFYIYPHRQYTTKEKEFLSKLGGYLKVQPFPEGFQSGDLEIVSIGQGEAPLSFQVEGDDQTLLKVSLPQELPPGGQIEIHLSFKVKVPHAYGRFGWHENIIKLSRWYPILA